MNRTLSDAHSSPVTFSRYPSKSVQALGTNAKQGKNAFLRYSFLFYSFTITWPVEGTRRDTQSVL